VTTRPPAPPGVLPLAPPFAPDRSTVRLLMPGGTV
jgi:hypothetical protein